jgi:hypothetical protein
VLLLYIITGHQVHMLGTVDETILQELASSVCGTQQACYQHPTLVVIACDALQVCFG